MHELWPSGDAAQAMSREELAATILGLLASPEARSHGVPRQRGSFVAVAVSQHMIAKRREAGIRGQIQVHGDDAIAAFPDLARAYVKAWDLLEREGLIAAEPGSDDVYVSAAGEDRLASGTGGGGAARASAHSGATETEARQVRTGDGERAPDVDQLAKPMGPPPPLPHSAASQSSGPRPAQTMRDDGLSSGEVSLFVGALGIVALFRSQAWWVTMLAIVAITVVVIVAIRRLAPRIRSAIAGPARPSRRSARVRIALAVGVAVVIVACTLLLLRTDHRHHRGVPPAGWFTDATTGISSPPRPISQVKGLPGDLLETGDIFWACNDSVAGPCRFTPGRDQTVDARRGDVLYFRARFHTPYNGQIALLKLRVDASRGESPRTVRAILWIEWPSRRTGSQIASANDDATIALPDGGRYALKYEPGSARLVGSPYAPGGQRVIATLPDGIMGGGSVVLTHIGSPRGCWDCDLEYERFIQFAARVV